MASLLDDPSLELGGALDKVAPQTPVSGRVIRPPRSILDVVTGAGQAIGEDVTNMGWGLLDYIMTPGKVASGEIPAADVPRAAQGFAANTALLGAGLPAPAGSLRMLAGVDKAAAVDTQALRVAQTMAAAGASPETIWTRTGHYQDAFGNWRFEIPDQGARLVAPPGTTGTTAGQAFEHPEAYRQYPELEKLPVRFQPMRPGSSGVLYRDASGQPAFMQINSLDPASEQLKTFLHEGQHSIQNYEGLPGGAQVEDFLPPDYLARQHHYHMDVGDYQTRAGYAGLDQRTIDLAHYHIENPTAPITPEGQAALDRVSNEPFLKDLVDTMKTAKAGLDADYLKAHGEYQKVAGEAESRNVEDRFDMPPDIARQLIPTSTQPVPFGQETIAPNEVRPLGPRPPSPVQWTWPNILSALAGLQQGQQ
jgi:hypothetical protein